MLSNFELFSLYFMWFPSDSVVKKSACNGKDSGSIPGSGRSPDGGHDNLHQYSCLQNLMDREGW